MRPIFVLILLSFLLIGCQDYGGERPAVVTNKTVFLLGEPIDVTISNETEPAIYLLNCCGSPEFHIDRRESERWIQYDNHLIPCPLMCPGCQINVAISQPVQTNVGGNEIEQRGTYRLRFFFQRGEAEPGLSELTSNTFTVD